MTEPPDPLEAELFTLRPREVSPELRRRIAERLAEPLPFPRYRRLWQLALVGGLAAACLAVILLLRSSGSVVPPSPPDRPPTPAAVAVEDANPTVLAYQRALARSPEELDALLDKDAASAPEPNPELAHLGAFTRSDATLYALLGDD
jgi:hypothetical protein